MDINSANMNILFQALNLKFKNAFNAAVSTAHAPFTMEVSMGTRELVMPFMEQITGMREWIGPRVKNNISTNKLTVTARKFELTQGIPRDSIEDDQYAMYTPIFEQMGAMAANLPADLVAELLNGAASKKWVDGVNFFATNRKYSDKATICNTTTAALSEASLKTAYDTMKQYKGHGGKSLRVRPTHLIHGPATTWVAKEILENPQKVVSDTNGAAAVPNLCHNLVERIELPELEGNTWFLAACGSAFKPVCYFSRRKPDTLVRKDRPTDDNVFDNDEYIYGCDGRAEAALVMPHLIYMGKPA